MHVTDLCNSLFSSWTEPGRENQGKRPSNQALWRIQHTWKWKRVLNLGSPEVICRVVTIKGGVGGYISGFVLLLGFHFSVWVKMSG